MWSVNNGTMKKRFKETRVQMSRNKLKTKCDYPSHDNIRIDVYALKKNISEKKTQKFARTTRRTNIDQKVYE